MNKRGACTLAILGLVLAQLACGQPAPEHVLRGWTVTPAVLAQPTQTAVLVQETVVVLAQETVVVLVQVTPTPARFCVVAQEAVNLRPSASETGYPIAPLAKGTEVFDLGGRENGFMFVKLPDNRQGWVYSKYIGDC